MAIERTKIGDEKVRLTEDQLRGEQTSKYTRETYAEDPGEPQRRTRPNPFAKRIPPTES